MAEIGLCADCQLARRVQNRRGSEFVLCTWSKHDPSYPRYPRLPVLRCAAYRPERETPTGQDARGDR